jgi:hypothetical protein
MNPFKPGQPPSKLPHLYIQCEELLQNEDICLILFPVFSAFEDQLINVIISNFSFYVEFPCSSLLNTFCLWRQWVEWTPNFVRRQNTDNEKKSQRAIITHKGVLKPNLLVRAINGLMHEGIINTRVMFFQEMEYNTLLYFTFCKTKASVCFCLRSWSKNDYILQCQ